MTYSHFTASERTRFESLLQAGVSIKAIAAQLGRDRSTLFRERRRNGLGNSKCALVGVSAACRAIGYEAKLAQSTANVRARRANARPTISAQRWQEAETLLVTLDLSPEQIGRQIGISAEHIYRYIYRRIGEGKMWHKHLRSGRAKRLHRRSRLAAVTASASRAKPIAQRPEYVNQRRRFGHWEADLLLGRRDNSAAVLVVKERMSRLTLLAKVGRKDSKTVMRAMRKLLRPYEGLTHTITTDNGSEFFRHQQFAEATKCTMYVCEPHSPWQRGQVEGENKNLRQYLPKSFDADRLTTARLKRAEQKINMRPKRVLNHHTALEVAFSLSGVALRY